MLPASNVIILCVQWDDMGLNGRDVSRPYNRVNTIMHQSAAPYNHFLNLVSSQTYTAMLNVAEAITSPRDICAPCSHKAANRSPQRSLSRS